MELICCESGVEARAYTDPALLNERVLRNLLKTEENCTTNSSYFNTQSEITPGMRKIVAEWMLELCEENKCQEEVFSLAMNYMDRVLHQMNIARTQLQLLGSICLLIASKLREPNPLNASQLVYYTDFSITLEQIWEWEMLVVTKLKWNLSAVTPQDFIPHILVKLPQHTKPHHDTIKRHAITFIALSARDHKLSSYTPSLLAGGSIIAAVHGNERFTNTPGCSLRELLDLLHRLLGIEKDYLQTCFTQIEEMLTESLNATDQSSLKKENEEDQKPHTPTDVRDVDF